MFHSESDERCLQILTALKVRLVFQKKVNPSIRNYLREVYMTLSGAVQRHSDYASRSVNTAGFLFS